MNKQTFLIICIFVCGCLGNYFLFTTVCNDFEKGRNMGFLERQYESTKFDYFHGIWLIFHGLFFVLLLVFFDAPSFETIYKHFRSEFIKKFF